jgi:TP901 family phage tail tape measure protein
MTDISSFIDVKITSDGAKKGAREVDQSLGKIAKSTGEVDKRFKKSGEQAEKTGKKIAKSTNTAKKGVLGLNSSVGKLAQSMSSIPLGSGAAILALGAAAVKVIKIFGEFDQAIANLSAITGAAGKDLEFLSDSAREMGKVTTLSASQVAEAFQLVASAKPDLLSNAEALKQVTQETITLAEAAGITLPEAANTMASALNQFGAGADQANRFINVLAAGSKFGAASIAQMGESLKFSGVAAASFGITFEQTNAALQLLSTNAIKGSEAGTNLRGVILALETKMDDQFKPSVVGITQAFENLSKENLNASEQVKLFGKLNIVAGQILTNNEGKLQGLIKDLTGTSIATEQAAIRTATLQGSYKKFGSAAEELALILSVDGGLGRAWQGLVDLGTSLLLGINHVVGGFISFIKFVGETTGATETLTREFKDFDEVIGDLARNFQGGVLTFVGLAAKAFITLGEVLVGSVVIPLITVRKGIDETVDAFLSLQISVLEFTGGSEEAIFILESMKANSASLTDQIKEFDKGFSDARAEVDAFVASGKENIELLQQTKTATKELAEETEKAAKEEEGFATGVQTVIDRLDEEFAALQRNSEEQAIHLAIKEAGVTALSEEGRLIAEKVKLLEAEKERLSGLAVVTKKVAKESEKFIKNGGQLGEFKDGIDGVSDATGKLTTLFGKNKKARAALLTLNKAATAIEIASSVKKIAVDNTETGSKLVNSAAKTTANSLEAITSAFSAPFPVNFVAGAAMIGIMAALLGGKSGGGGGGNIPTAESLQRSQGTGTLLGSDEKSESIGKAQENFEDISLDQLFELKGIRNSLNDLSSGITELAKNVIIGTSKKDLQPGETDRGLAFNSQTLGSLLAGEGIDARSFTTIKKTKRGFFSKKVSFVREFEQLDSNISNQVTSIFESVADTVVSAAEVLGFSTVKQKVSTGFENLGSFFGAGAESFFGSFRGGFAGGLKENFKEVELSLRDAIKNFQIDIGDISLEGLSGEEIEKELGAVFSAQSDLIAEFLIPSIKEYQKIGEGSFETLTRVAKEQAIFNDSLEAMGISFRGLSNLFQIDIAQSIIQVVGGIEKFSELSNEFFNEFLTEEEQFTQKTKSLRESLASINIALFDSRQQFVDTITGIDKTTKSGQKLFGSLLELVPALDDFFDTVEEKDKKLLKEIIKTEKDALSEIAKIEIDSLKERSKTEIDSLRERSRAISVSISSLTSLSSSLENAIKSTQQTDNSARLDRRKNAQAQISSALAISKAGGSLSGINLKDSLEIVSRPSADLFNSFQDYIRDFQLTNNSLVALNKETEEQLSIEEQTLSLIEAQTKVVTENTNQQIDLLNSNLVAALEQVDVLNSIDKSLSGGRNEVNPKSPGFTIGTGTLGEITIPIDSGPGFDFTGPNKKVRALKEKSVLDNGELLLEIKLLREEVKRGNFAVAKNTLRTSKVLDRWDGDGTPAERVV